MKERRTKGCLLMASVKAASTKAVIMTAVVAAALCASCSGTSYEYAYQNPELSAEERAEDLLGRLSLEQKITLMMSDSEEVPEWGIHAYNWWNEALHGAARSGLATVFPQAIGMAASWNDSLLEQVFDVASTEQRIKYIQARKYNNDSIKRYSGLSVWTPNINIFRDPRWGRGQETYGEDPFLTAQMGGAVVRGLQGEAKHPHLDIKSPYDKLHACLKHYAVHSGPEYERHGFNATDISLRDMNETYLYAFERLVKTTDVKEVMCAYNAVEGRPCCGSDNLLTQILRNEWGYRGLVVSDCWAIKDFYDGRPNFHNVYDNGAEASANAVLSGTDLECGQSFNHLVEAVERGAIDEKDIDVALMRVLKARFEMGDMDLFEADPWNSIPESELVSEYNSGVALQMARESMTLLHNRNNTLPLAKQKADGKKLKVAVVGPNANDSLTLWGNYCGQAPHTVTVLDGIRQKLGNTAEVTYRKVSEWVAREEFHSVFSQCVADGKNGMKVQYWNNTKQEGTPDVEAQIASPFQYCTSGATVFAPGVNLTDFSARYATSYHATGNLDLLFDVFLCGQAVLTVTCEGDTVCSKGFRMEHGARHFSAIMQTKKGKDYEIALDYNFLVPDAQLNFDFGVKLPTDIRQMLADTKDADLYIYVGGISPMLEGEEMKVYFEGFKGGDRESIQLPKVQRETLQALHKTGKPVVFVCMSGSALGLAPELQSCDAILQAWYGGQAAGEAVADVLFGDYNPAGRLPITFYTSETELPDFHDYNMPGHTYRYFKGKPLFAFGYGLSYSSFAYGKATFAKASAPAEAVTKFGVDDELVLTIPVTNTSTRDGDEVAQVYIRKNSDVDGPRFALRGFKRQHIKAGETAMVSIPLNEFNFRTIDPETYSMKTTPGTYTIYYGCSSREEDLQQFTVECE